MNASECRRQYRNYRFALARARYDFYKGAASQMRRDEINNRYSDLWRRESIDEITLQRDKTPANFTTERAALERLAGALRLGFCGAQTRAVETELANCEASAQATWHSEKITVKNALARLSENLSGSERRELAARFNDAVASCHDLRAELINERRGAARKLGFENFRYCYESVVNFKLEPFADAATNFLSQTASSYSNALADWAREAFGLQTARELNYAETFALERSANLDRYLKAHEIAPLYRATVSEMGINAPPQAVALEESNSENLALRGAVCCALKPPEDVRVVYQTRRGAVSCFDFFRAAGRAQMFAFVSRELLIRYPEFVFAPDDTMLAGYAALFESFWRDQSWLAAHLPIKANEIQRIARGVALRKLFEIRRACAQLRFALALENSTDARETHLAETFSTLYAEATDFSYPAELYLFDSSAALERSAAFLRAELFAAAVRERLCARYGSRWWTQRAARDVLIDMWNTASRYAVEELAKLNDIGELSFELLAEKFAEALRES
jgi:hypothetical protein